MWSLLKCRAEFPLVHYRGSGEMPMSPAGPAASSHLLQTPSNDLDDPEDARNREPRDKVSWWCKLGLHAWRRHEARRRPGSFISRCRKCQRVVVRRRDAVRKRPDVPTPAPGEARFDEDRKIIPLKAGEWFDGDVAALRHSRQAVR